MHTLWVYIVRCADGIYYTGITNDVEKRVSEHNAGDDPKSFTFKRRPVTLVFSHEMSDHYEAINFEKQIKTWSRKKKEALIRGDEAALHALAECKNETHARNALFKKKKG